VARSTTGADATGPESRRLPGTLADRRDPPAL